ncbi:SLC13 family permease [Streptosporangium sp. NPDC002721]|uniref:SLC13 family permease n=1 Tax=Streptosporangium sp. NPDC002721 TaxID=3366188 RepID=UPI00369776D9
MSDVLRRSSVLDRIRFGLLGLGLLFVATGLLSFQEAWSEMERIGPILLFLAAVIVLADLVKEAQLFDVIATRLAVLGRGNHVALFLLCTVFASLVTMFLNLDTTVVLLTPVMLALAARTGIAALPLAMTTLWLANTAALLLPVSNLTNLLAMERLGMSAREFAGRLWFPQLVSITVTMVLLWLFFWRRGRRGAARYEPPVPGPIADPVLFRIAISACALFVAAILLELPIQFAALGGAAVMIAAFAWRDRKRLTLALFPWQLLVFVVGLFLSVFVFDRCGGMSIIEVPIEAHKDSTDHSDPCSGFVHPDGTVQQVCGVSAGAASPGLASDVCLKVIEAKNSCSWYRAQPQVPQNPATKTPYKGMTIQASGMHGWKPNPAWKLEELRVAKHRVWVQAYFTKNFLDKYKNQQFIKNVSITVTDKFCAKTLSGVLNITFPPGYEPMAGEECEKKIVRGEKGDRVLHYPTQGDDNLEVTCKGSLPGLCHIREFQIGFDAEIHPPFKNPGHPDGRIRMAASSCWDLPNRYGPPIALGHSCPKHVKTLYPEL